MSEQTDRPDEAEEAARVVEAFAENVIGETRELLDRIAAAIRDRAWSS